MVCSADTYASNNHSQISLAFLMGSIYQAFQEPFPNAAYILLNQIYKVIFLIQALA